MPSDDVNDHRLRSLEEKVDQVLALMRQVLTMESDLKHMSKDVDRAHERIRALDTSVQYGAGAQGKTDTQIVDLERTAAFVNDPKDGIAVRMSRVEGSLAQQGRLLSYIGVTLIGSLLAVLGTILSGAWSKFTGG